MTINISIRNDSSEILRYNYENFPAYIHKNLLSNYAQHSAIVHWHDDIEFIVVLEGEMDYTVNAETIHLRKNEGIFINSKQLHRGFSPSYSECEFICVILNPILLCSQHSIENKFVNSIINNPCIPYFLLHTETEWENNIMEIVKQIYLQRQEEVAPLIIQSHFFRIWSLLYENFRSYQTPAITHNSHSRLTTMKEMLSFIQRNYMDKITLGDIAKSGNVSKTTCSNLFKTHLHETPVNYLIRYRIMQSEELLKTTDKSISEIAYEVGFSDPSYYTASFQKIFQHSPTNHKKVLKTSLQLEI